MSAKQSAAQRLRWENPEARAKHSVALKAPAVRVKIAAGVKRAWKDPAYRARVSAKMNDPTTRAKTSAETKREDRPCLDHDHATDAIRGVLCDPCNGARGLHCLGPTRRWVVYLEFHAAHPGPHRWSALSQRKRRELRQKVLREQGGRCAVCQRELNEKAHGA